VRDRQQVAAGGALPDWALHRAFVPFAHLLPRAAALVHLGGIGGAAQALQAGVPQFILPLQFDQFDNADRLQRLGVARWRRNGSAWQRWVEPLQSLLSDPAVARACAQAQQRLQARTGPEARSIVRPDALDDAADQVQRLAARP
jgi:rhamnosyltransferase subunit B